MGALLKILYVACFLIANPAGVLARALIEIYDKPGLPLTQSYISAEGNRGNLGPSNTKIRIVNFWALWCQDCIDELPSLVALERLFEDRELEIITIATGKNDQSKAEALFENLGAGKLTQAYDPNSRLAAQAGAPTVPYTILLNGKGEEIGRVIGGVNWSSPEMIAQIRSIISTNLN